MDLQKEIAALMAESVKRKPQRDKPWTVKVGATDKSVTVTLRHP